MTQPVLELSGIRKSYGNHVAVETVDLRLDPEEFVTFLGPSGSGKTTTLMMVAGLQQPDAGTIRLGGAPIEGQPPYRRDIGMVFQHYALFPHMSVRKNVAFPLEMRGVAKAEITRQVGEALELVGLGDYGHRLPRELSGGQQQRVALARAMVLEPSLLLADEPTGNLDRSTGEAIHQLFLELNRERGSTLLVVTHNPDLAALMPRRLRMIDGGRLIPDGIPPHGTAAPELASPPEAGAAP